ncbi:MAG: hypothetical protein ACKOC6_12215 [bacterium]
MSRPQCQAPEPAGAPASATARHSSRRLKRTGPCVHGAGFQKSSAAARPTTNVSKPGFDHARWRAL